MKSRNNKLKIDNWKFLKTEASEMILEICSNAFNHSLMYCLIANTGMGKSTSFDFFLEQNPENVFVIKLEKGWTPKDLHRKMLAVIGVVNYTEKWINLKDMSSKFAYEISNSNKKFLIIFDEAGKFSSDMIEYFQTIRDKTEKNLGIIISGTSVFQKKMEKWNAKNEGAIPELISRFTGKFSIIPASTKSERFQIAKRNGVVDPNLLRSIANETKNYREVFNRVIEYRLDNLKNSVEDYEENKIEV